MSGASVADFRTVSAERLALGIVSFIEIEKQVTQNSSSKPLPNAAPANRTRDSGFPVSHARERWQVGHTRNLLSTAEIGFGGLHEEPIMRERQPELQEAFVSP